MTNLRSLVFLFLFWLAACGGGSNADNTQPVDTPLPPAQPTSAEIPTDGNGVQLAAKVNNDGITITEFERALARQQLEITDAASEQALHNNTLDMLIEQRLITQGATAQNIVVTDEEVQSELQSLVEQAGSQETWDAWLQSNLFTTDEYPSILRANLTFKKVRDSLTTDLEGNVLQVHARHILLRTETEAKDILDRLNAGEDFATLAANYSQDETTRAQGGDLGWFTRDELFTPELAEVAFSLQQGQIAGPVATDLGYHVIQNIEVAERPLEPLERQVYIAQARFEHWLRPLYDNAIIERYV
ncbi:MAG: peptidylprolyl isomerase [Anaerolineae bacterium]